MFHAIYERTPQGFKAELIGGIVYVMASPVWPRHGRAHFRVTYWLGVYPNETDGPDVLDNTTSVLGGESEPRPDACLLILPEYGGRATVVEDKHVSGPLDLVVEVANSSRAIDLGAQRRDYEQAGVREDVVILTKEKAVRWFRLTDGEFVDLPPGQDGVFRSAAFPGLRLHPKGVFALTSRPLTAAVRCGLATPEHAAFVAELAARRTKLRTGKVSPRKTK